MTIAVVTPWLDHLELAPAYLQAVRAGQPEELLVVDNGSRPPLEFAYWRNNENRGFAAASNQGLAMATSDAVLFLNNDIVMHNPDWLDRIRAAVEPGVLVGARLRTDQHGSVDGVPLPYLDGWCLAGTRDDLLELGGFDETYQEPAYYSDNDLCLRARAAGMRLREVRVGLSHLSGTTSQAAHNPAVRDVIEANYELFASIARDLLAVAA